MTKEPMSKTYFRTSYIARRDVGLVHQYIKILLKI